MWRVDGWCKTNCSCESIDLSLKLCHWILWWQIKSCDSIFPSSYSFSFYSFIFFETHFIPSRCFVLLLDKLEVYSLAEDQTANGCHTCWCIWYILFSHSSRILIWICFPKRKSNIERFSMASHLLCHFLLISSRHHVVPLSLQVWEMRRWRQNERRGRVEGIGRKPLWSLTSVKFENLSHVALEIRRFDRQELFHTHFHCAVSVAHVPPSTHQVPFSQQSFRLVMPLPTWWVSWPVLGPEHFIQCITFEVIADVFGLMRYSLVCPSAYASIHHDFHIKSYNYLQWFST